MQSFFIPMQFAKLEEMHYRCLAFVFFEDNVQVVSTSDCSSYVTPRYLEYLHALAVVGMSTYFT